jgi:phospholipid N-methyltransferase
MCVCGYPYSLFVLEVGYSTGVYVLEVGYPTSLFVLEVGYSTGVYVLDLLFFGYKPQYCQEVSFESDSMGCSASLTRWLLIVESVIIDI